MKRMIEKKITLLIGLVLLCSSLVTAQLSEEVEKVTPELPGEIMIDFGFNFINDAPDKMDTHWFRSKSFSVFFVKPFDFGKSMSFRPGIGVSIDKLGTADPYTINYLTNENNVRYLGFDSIPGGDVTKSQFVISYAEIPLEVRYDFGGNEGKGGAYLALGGSFGFKFDSYTKVKYEEFGNKIKERRKDDFRTSKVRLGASARFGYRNFGVFYKWYATDIFLSDGPLGTADTSYSTIGISLSGF